MRAFVGICFLLLLIAAALSVITSDAAADVANDLISRLGMN